MVVEVPDFDYPLHVERSGLKALFTILTRSAEITDEMKQDMALCETNANPADRCDKCSWYGKIIEVDDGGNYEYIPLCAIEEITKKYSEKPTPLGVGWIAQNKKCM